MPLKVPYEHDLLYGCIAVFQDNLPLHVSPDTCRWWRSVFESLPCRRPCLGALSKPAFATLSLPPRRCYPWLIAPLLCTLQLMPEGASQARVWQCPAETGSCRTKTYTTRTCLSQNGYRRRAPREKALSWRLPSLTLKIENVF